MEAVLAFLEGLQDTAERRMAENHSVSFLRHLTQTEKRTGRIMIRPVNQGRLFIFPIWFD